MHHNMQLNLYDVFRLLLHAGSTLRNYILRSPFTGLDAYTALVLMQNLLRILQYLQTKNVIHNDIKGINTLSALFG